MAFWERGREQTKMKVLRNYSHISYTLWYRFQSLYEVSSKLFVYLFFFVKSGIYPTKIYYRPTASAKRNEKKRKKKTWAQSQRRAYRLLVIPSRISFSSFHLSILLFDLHRISPPVILLLLFWFWYIFHYETPTYAWKISKKLVDVKALSFLVFFFCLTFFRILV